MWLEITEKLVENCIKVLNKKVTNRKTFYNEYIKPVYDDFEIIHKDYLNTFSSVRVKLQDEQINIQDIVKEIETKYLFSEGQRDKLRRITSERDAWLKLYPNIGYFVKDKPSVKHDSINVFVSKIHSYLTIPYADGTQRPQKWYMGFMSIIELLAEFSIIRKDRDTIAKELKIESVKQWNKLKMQELDEKINKNIPKPLELKEEATEQLDSLLTMRTSRIRKSVLKKITEDYIDCIHHDKEFNEKSYAIKYLDMMIEAMQKIYGEISEINWNLKNSLLLK